MTNRAADGGWLGPAVRMVDRHPLARTLGVGVLVARTLSGPSGLIPEPPAFRVENREEGPLGAVV